MNARKGYLKVLQERYFMAKSRKEKSAILDEYCKNTGQNRKYVIRKIRSPISLTLKKRGGKPVVYDGHVKTALAKVWDIFDYPCGQRLAPLLKTEVDRLRQQEEIFISNEVAEKLKKISPKPLSSSQTSKTGSSPKQKIPSKKKSFNLPENSSESRRLG